MLQGIGGNAHVGLSFKEKAGNVFWAYLLERQAHIGKCFFEVRDDAWKRVARLRMRRGHDKRTVVALGNAGRKLFKVLGFKEDTFDDRDNSASRFGEAEETFSSADENLETGLAFARAKIISF